MAANRNTHPIPRTTQAASRLGFKKRTERKHLLKGASDAQKRKMVLVSLDASGVPTRYCHFDPNTGLWVCSDS